MNRTLSMGALPAAVMAMTFVMTSPVALAQKSTEEVKIEAAKVVTVRHGHSRTGIENETVQVSHKVSLADLDTATPAGAAELQSRIRDTADSICRQLGELYPAGSARNEEVDQSVCVKGAVENAMSQARQAIASAEGAKQR